MNPRDPRPLDNIPLGECPVFEGRISVRGSAVATFYAPSDYSGINGMWRERIYSVPMWRKSYARRDCVFLEQDPDMPGMRGLAVACVRFFMMIHHQKVPYPSALLEWFSCTGDSPDNDTGLWVVAPDYNEDGSRSMSIVHINTILRAAHLLPVFGEDFLPDNFHFSNTLDAFDDFFVNKFIDHHANENAF